MSGSLYPSHLPRPALIHMVTMTTTISWITSNHGGRVASARAGCTNQRNGEYSKSEKERQQRRLRMNLVSFFVGLQFLRIKTGSIPYRKRALAGCPITTPPPSVSLASVHPTPQHPVTIASAPNYLFLSRTHCVLITDSFIWPTSLDLTFLPATSRTPIAPTCCKWISQPIVNHSKRMLAHGALSSAIRLTAEFHCFLHIDLVMMNQKWRFHQLDVLSMSITVTEYGGPNVVDFFISGASRNVIGFARNTRTALAEKDGRRWKLRPLPVVDLPGSKSWLNLCGSSNFYLAIF